MPDIPVRHSKANRMVFENWKRLLPVLLPLSLVIAAGIWGVDFGNHWDEDKLIPQLRDTIRTGVFLPGWYRYPSITYWLNLLGLAPYIVGIAAKGGAEPSDLRAYLIDVTGGDIFRLQARKIFIVVSALAILWVYLFILVDRKRSWMESLLGALFLGFSWEVGYHMRWIAPDGVLMQFGALTIFFVFLALQADRRKYWLWAAAVAAGLGMGSKYPGGLLLVPVLMAAFRLRVRSGWGILLEVLFAFGVSFVLSTPGVFLQPKTFFSDVLSEVSHYQTGHYGYVVSPWEHLGLMSTYFSQVTFSHYRGIALVLFLFSLAGIFALTRESWQDTVLFLSFPLLYVVFFSFQRVMIVRNLLVLIPFGAILSARGVCYLWDKMHHWLPKAAFGLLIPAIVIVNGVWLFRAAHSITLRGTDDFTRQLIAYFDENPQMRFLLSDKVMDDIESLGEPTPSNVIGDGLESVDMVVFYASEGMEKPADWPRNRPGIATKFFGPWEVNFDYYPTWAGDDRVLVMPFEKAREMGIKALTDE